MSPPPTTFSSIVPGDTTMTDQTSYPEEINETMIQLTKEAKHLSKKHKKDEKLL
jgi:hydrogenase maturation factor